MASSIPSFQLNDDRFIPAIGIGCWMGRIGEGQHVVDMVKKGLEIGYRHIDTAANYGQYFYPPYSYRFLAENNNRVGDEGSIGRAIKESGVSRHDLFITTKLASEDHGRVAQALDASLKKLGLDYVDLYLMHWPQALKDNGEANSPDESPTFIETWAEMEKLLASDRVKTIGVSNFSVKTLSALLSNAIIIPAVNQVEAHPCLPQNELMKFCKERGILITAYSPVGKHKFAGHKSLVDIAQRRGVTAAQVLLSWGVQRGMAVIPKTEREERLAQNFLVGRKALTENGMILLNKPLILVDPIDEGRNAYVGYYSHGIWNA